MRIALAVAALLLAPQDQKKDLKPVNEKMAKVKNYHFAMKVTVESEVKLDVEGEYFAPEALHSRSEKGETARHGDKKLVKTKDEDWREPGKVRGKLEHADATMPHEWVKKISDECPIVKREKSDKIGGTTVDIYVYALGAENAKKAAEAGGMPFIASLVDWSKTQNGVLFYVGRDDLYYKVEFRFDAPGRRGKSGTIVMEFSEFGRAKCRLPDDVKKKLGIE